MRRALVTILVLASTAQGAKADEAAGFFESRVRPLLVSQCYECHTRAAEGELRLDSRAAILTGGTSGPAMVPGDPASSLLIQAVKRTHDSIHMPPERALAPRDVQVLESWIRAGAVWPASDADRLRVADQHGIAPADRAFWSYQPVVRVSPPAIDSRQWGPHPIDAFVIADLQEHQLSPGSVADPRVLIRRATFDLTGLPPTLDDTDRFLQDAADGRELAYQRLIERLLASPSYGERWGQHWLDLVRYADTAGDAGDFPVPEAYKYRNYVIQSFNDDQPYDDFVREQIAGDLLPYRDDDERWRQIIATGYIAISRRIGVSPHGQRHIMLEDTIDNLGKTVLGLTIGCARCHDHKFDAIPSADYYALYGIFDSSVYPHPGAEHKPRRADFVYRMDAQELERVLRPHRDRLAEWDRRERAQFEIYRDFQRKDESQLKGTRQQAWAELLRLREARRPCAESFPDVEIAYALQEGEGHDVQLQQAGSPAPRDRGELVRRGFLQILGGARLADNATGSGRRELAEWLVDPENPLTARVMVNRVWHYHFGQGLVKTTSDFGVRGTRPTHPELLDFLAAYFTGHGWSLKQLHRLIMSSRTYQLASDTLPQNSAVDPNNDLLWRAPRRRLDAEQIRDSILFFSGDLDLTVGRRQPFPHRHTYFYRQHEPFLSDATTRRRSIYMLRQRIRKHDYLDLFDAADGNLHVGNRKSTTTTLQALFLMNSSFAAEQSAAIASRMCAVDSEVSGRVDWAYRTIFGRPPTTAEIAAAASYCQRAQSLSEQNANAEEAVWAGYIRGMIGSNEFMFVD